MNLKEFGMLFKQRRLEKGFSSQDSLKEAIGVTQQAIAGYENGNNFPKKDIWPAIEKELDLDMEDLSQKVVQPSRQKKIKQLAINNAASGAIYQSGGNQKIFNNPDMIPTRKKILIDLILKYAPDTFVEENITKLTAIRDVLNS